MTFVSVGWPPPAPFVPPRLSEMPMTRMMVPVAAGGNSGRRRLAKGATRNPKRPAPIAEP